MKDFKERYFAQYWGQNIGNVFGETWITLTPLSAISDKDAIEVAKLNRSINWNNGLTPHVYENTFGVTVVTNGMKHIQKYGQTLIGFEFLTPEQADKCRELGYALPYGGKSVEELIEMKLLKLKG